jgi:hypothetical protein
MQNQNQSSTTEQQVYDIAKETGHFFKDSFGKPYVKFNTGSRFITCSVNDKRFSNHLLVKAREKNGHFLSSKSLTSVLQNIEAETETRDNVQQVFNRVGKIDQSFWYDLNDKNGNLVVIQDGKWFSHPQDPSTANFRSTNNTGNQVTPIENGDLRKILSLFNFTSKDDAEMFLVSLVTCFIPGIQHPIIAFHGPKGSAKSTSLKVLKKIVDPGPHELSSLPSKVEDITLQVASNHLVCYDNLDHISAAQSDRLCQVVSGGSMTKRQFYRDEDTITTKFSGGIVAVNGINLVVTRPDLLDRTVTFELSRISPERRRTEEDLMEELEQILPEVVGGIFDTLARAIPIHKTLSVGNLPRMADFYKWGCAIAEVTGLGAKRFKELYSRQMEKSVGTAIDNNPVALAIQSLIHGLDKWDGFVGELYKALGEIAEDQGYAMDSRWPRSSNQLLNRINEIEVDLKEIGITVHRGSKGNKGYRVTILNQNTALDESSEKPHFKTNCSEPDYDDFLKEFEDTDCWQNGNIIKSSHTDNPNMLGEPREHGDDILQSQFTNTGDDRAVPFVKPVVQNYRDHWNDMREHSEREFKEFTESISDTDYPF